MQIMYELRHSARCVMTHTLRHPQSAHSVDRGVMSHVQAALGMDLIYVMNILTKHFQVI
jgi:hypothetical protein